MALLNYLQRNIQLQEYGTDVDIYICKIIVVVNYYDYYHYMYIYIYIYIYIYKIVAASIYQYKK